MITYADGVTAVMIGDWVELRVFFRKRRGRVMYVPGVSKLHPEFEFNGLTWVGIDIPKGPAFKAVVNFETNRLRENITFIGRDSEGAVELDPSEELT